MTSHELARLLLKGEDLKVIVRDHINSDWNEISHIRLIKRQEEDEKPENEIAIELKEREE